MMESKPGISVILPVYNQEKFISETIGSVLSQTYSDFEFLVVDDGSTDNSAAIIRSYAEKDKRIKAFFEPNAGKSNATNYLVNKASGDWCAFLDADDVMMPERLERQMAFNLSDPEIAASSVHCYYINEKGQMFGKQRYANLQSLAECKMAMRNEWGKKKFITCSFTGLMVLRTAYLDSGGLRTQFEPCEDFEFVNRLVHNHGYILVILQETLMKYRIHSGAITERKPFLIFDTITYIKLCLNRREKKLPEITFTEFVAIRQNDPWFARINRKRYNYSRILIRNAGFSMLSKKYISFMGQIATASLLSPEYVFQRLKNLLKK